MSQPLSTIKKLLAERGLRPRHRLGQNFLHDAGKMRRMIETIAPERGEAIVEVGAGTGSLTEGLLEAGANVLAVEVDPQLCAILRERIGEDRAGWKLLECDALAGKHAVNPAIAEALREFAASHFPSHESQAASHKAQVPSFTLTGNLPYNIASPLLATMASGWPAMRRAVVMVQKEVADRLTAGPGSKQYGPLGIVVQAMCEVKTAMTLPPGCFWPRPRVSSAVVTLDRRDAPLTDDPAALSAMTQRLFTKRRKQLGSILGREATLPEGVVPTQRPEELSVERICELAARHGEPARKS